MNALQTQGVVGSVDLTGQVSLLVNQLFQRLCAYCNRWRYNFPTDESLEEGKFIWIEELINHDVLTVAQLERGLAKVRSNGADYFPNIFDFIGWCKLPEGFPTEDILYQRLVQFQRFGMLELDRFEFNSTVEYWLLTDLYCRGRRAAWSVEQTKKEIKIALKAMADRLIAGEVLPEPKKQLAEKPTSVPVSRERMLAAIAEMKSIIG